MLALTIALAVAAELSCYRISAPHDAKPSTAQSATQGHDMGASAGTAEVSETIRPLRTPQPKPTPQPARLYEIELSDELQFYTFNLCEEYGVDYEMVLALMERESDYRANVVSGTNDYGLMQINTINHETLREKLGITDFLDPEQNILCGVYLLSKLTAKYDDPHRILMAYNMGEAGARRYVANGNASTNYSTAILERRAELLQEGGDDE